MKKFFHRLFLRHTPVAQVGILGTFSFGAIAIVLILSGEPTRGAIVEFSAFMMVCFGSVATIGILRAKSKNTTSSK